MVNTLSGQAPWRNLILSSTAYPASQAGIPQHQVHHIPRHEYDLWMHVVQNFSNGRTPSFSDYPTASSTITSVDPRFMSQYVSVRYSNDTSWIFVKVPQLKEMDGAKLKTYVLPLLVRQSIKSLVPNLVGG